ncbi:malate synthase [Burkholderia pseudomallei]|nr:malate synthase [Burkholderia pseudomallei]
MVFGLAEGAAGRTAADVSTALIGNLLKRYWPRMMPAES